MKKEKKKNNKTKRTIPDHYSRKHILIINETLHIILRLNVKLYSPSCPAHT